MITKNKKIAQDAGANWTQLMNIDVYDGNFKTLYITPTGRVIAGDTMRVRYSDDNGETWTSLANVPILFGIIAISTGRLIAGSWNGSCYSDDNGITWTQLNPDDNDLVQIYCVTSTGRILGVRQYDGIWYSDDNGIHWTKSISSSIGHAFGKIDITPTGRIIVGSSISNGLWYSDDDGETWTQSNKTDDAFPSVHVIPSGRIIASTYNNGIWYSDDNGVNWTQSNFTSDIAGLAFVTTSTGRVIASSDYDYDYGKGVWYSDDNGVNWTQSNLPERNGEGYTNRFDLLCVTSTGRVIVCGSWSNSNNGYPGVWYSDPVYQDDYAAKPLTGAQARELVTQCKAYVQSKKQS